MFWWLKVHIARPAKLCLWLVGLASCICHAWLKLFSSSGNVCILQVMNCSFAGKHVSCQGRSSSGAALQSVSVLDLQTRQTPPGLSLPNKPKHTAVARAGRGRVFTSRGTTDHSALQQLCHWLFVLTTPLFYWGWFVKQTVSRVWTVVALVNTPQQLVFTAAVSLGLLGRADRPGSWPVNFT